MADLDRPFCSPGSDRPIFSDASPLEVELYMDLDFLASFEVYAGKPAGSTRKGPLVAGPLLSDHVLGQILLQDQESILVADIGELRVVLAHWALAHSIWISVEAVGVSTDSDGLLDARLDEEPVLGTATVAAPDRGLERFL